MPLCLRYRLAFLWMRLFHLTLCGWLPNYIQLEQWVGGIGLLVWWKFNLFKHRCCKCYSVFALFMPSRCIHVTSHRLHQFWRFSQTRIQEFIFVFASPQWVQQANQPFKPRRGRQPTFVLCWIESLRSRHAKRLGGNSPKVLSVWRHESEPSRDANLVVSF